jgi:hypothetical protein
MPYYVNEWTLESIKNFSDPLDDCCIWRGGKHKQGYGMMRYKGKMRTVHSVITELKYGEKPTKYSGTRATRTCDNVACCNPDHIVIKNASDIRSGIYPPKRTLSMETVREIREEYAKGDWGRGKKLAEKYNVTIHLIYAIANGRIYKETFE